MKPGRLAASDGSFAKSAGGAGLRGLVLLGVALLIGVVLLNSTDADPPGSVVSARGDSDTVADDGSGGEEDASGETPSGGATPTTAGAPATTAVPARAPKDVKIIVANASPTKGAAGNASNVLKPAGYNVLSPTNAAPVNDSSVFFAPGYDQDAKAIALLLKLPATSVKPLPVPPPFPVNTANVAIVLGAVEAASFGSATPTTASTLAGSGATSTTSASSSASTTTTAGTATTRRP